MIRPNQQTIKAVSSLKGNHNFIHFISLLEEEKAFAMTGLMTASTDKVGALQGRTQILDELLKLVQETK